MTSPTPQNSYNFWKNINTYILSFRARLRRNRKLHRNPKNRSVFEEWREGGGVELNIFSETPNEWYLF